MRSSVSRRTLEVGAFVTAPAAGRANARPSSERYRLADLTSSVNAHESLLDIAHAPAVLAVLELDVHPFAGLVEYSQPCPDRKLAERSKRHVRPKEDRRRRRGHRRGQLRCVTGGHPGSWRVARCGLRSGRNRPFLAEDADLGWVADALVSAREQILERWLEATAGQPFHAGRREHLDRPDPGGESWREAVARVGRFLADLKLRWSGQRVLVIGHTATRWGLEHYLRGARLEDLAGGDFTWQAGWEYVLR